MISVGSWKCHQRMHDCQRTTCKDAFPFPTAWDLGIKLISSDLGANTLLTLQWNLFILLYYLNPTFLAHSTAVL